MTEKRAWGYVRLSQEGRDASLDEQKRQIREYAKENDIELLTTRNDGENTSGFNANRDGYQELRTAITEQRLDVVITRDRARLSRDFDDRLSLITDFRDTGIEWHVIEAGGKLGLDDVQTAGLEAIQGAMDHVKKMVEIKRSKQAMQERKDRGCYQGTPPYGLKFHSDGCHLEKHPQEWENIQTIIEGRENDVSLSEIKAKDEIDCSLSTISKVESRGLEFYAEKLAEYGL